jgi:hypothetical protein
MALQPSSPHLKPPLMYSTALSTPMIGSNRWPQSNIAFLNTNLRKHSTNSTLYIRQLTVMLSNNLNYNFRTRAPPT